MIPHDRPIIIGETAFHHEGDKDFLKKLIDAAEQARLEVIKFHLLFDLDDYMVKDHQARETLAKICISESDWNDLIKYLQGKNLKVIFLCNDVKSMNWVQSLDFENIIGIEIHATGINDIFLLEKASQSKYTVVLGTGGSSIDDINYAVSYLREKGKEDIFLMHGFQNYPTNYKDVILVKMDALHKLFGLPVGYADHTDPSDVNNEIISCLGIASGHNVIEKHFTIASGEKRIDSQSAVSLVQIKRIKELAQVIWDARGANSLDMSLGEHKYGDTGPMKKAIVARKNIAKGEEITMESVAFKRTNQSSYLAQKSLTTLLGQKAVRDIKQDEILDFTNIEFKFSIGDFSQFKAGAK